jgi:lipoate-protein ligase A
MSWIVIDTGARTGAFNMELDVELAMSLRESGRTGTLRFYRWQPFAISLGMHQDEAEVDREKVKRDGIDLVRRPTGGRAILHADEVTYSVTMLSKKKSIMQVYAEISQALAAGLNMLGIKAVLERNSPNFAALYRDPSSKVCFSSAGRFELKFQDKKIVGSAQRRYHVNDDVDVVLQHGSILLGPGHKKIIDYLVLKDEGERKEMRSELGQRTTDLKEILNRDVSYNEVVEGVKKGFEQTWNVKFERPEHRTEELIEVTA